VLGAGTASSAVVLVATSSTEVDSTCNQRG
jgi:hypothetical protein